jgi:hypothetical protein
MNLAYPLLDVVQQHARRWRETFQNAAAERTIATVVPALRSDEAFWAACAERWGCGPGYRDAVVIKVRGWFEDAGRRPAFAALEKQIELAWRTEVLKPLRMLSPEHAGHLGPQAHAA